MATISSLGIGSGLDVTTIISKLMSAESQPLTLMQQDATKIQSKISAYGKIQSYVSALSDAAKTLADPTSWGKTTAASANEGVFKATTSSGAAAGTYGVKVDSLAQGQTAYSTAFASASSTVGSGTLSIELGAWNSDQTAFTAKSGATQVDIAISGSDTLEQVRSKINAANAGVTASIVTDASGSKLVLRSQNTGAENAFRISVADDDGDGGDASGLSALAYDPSSGQSQLTRSQPATNAKATVDGIAVESPTNSIDGVIDGVTLQLTGTSTQPTALTLTADTTSMQSNVQAFVKAYNDLLGYMNTQTAYDAGSKTGGPLQGDSGTNGLRAAMRRLETGSAGISSTYSQLYQIGIDTNQDGTLKVDDTKLQAALASPDQMAKLFGRNGVGAGDDGFAQKLVTWADNLVSFDGAVTTRSQSLQKILDDNKKKQSDFNDKLTRIQAQLQAQYSALDTTMANASSLSNYVSQQITAWNKGG